MATVRIVRGAGTGPTATAAYDAALASANAHDFNLVTVSSVIPAGTNLEVVDALPALGPAGNRLTVVQSRVDCGPDASDPGVAGLGWARSATGSGILYEASGTDRDAVRQEIRRGLNHGVSLREWSVADSEVVLRNLERAPDAHACAVVLAAYGRSEPIV